jgi:two-component system chemotaxis response regulator CheY
MKESEIRALIVDDEEALRGILKIALTYFGVKVVGEAGNGVEGVERYKALKPNVVLMDINMPKMDGLRCLEEIRRVNPDAVVLLMTASDDESAMDKGRERGAKGFLRKPLVMDELHKDITNALREHFAKEHGQQLDQEYLRYNMKPGFRPQDEGRHVPAPPMLGATRKIREHQLAVERGEESDPPTTQTAVPTSSSPTDLSAPNPAANRMTLNYGQKRPTPHVDPVALAAQKSQYPPTEAARPTVAVNAPATASPVPTTQVASPTSSAPVSPKTLEILELELVKALNDLETTRRELDELRRQVAGSVEHLRNIANDLAKS